MVRMGNVWDRTAEFLSDNVNAVMPIAALAILAPTALDNAVAPLREGAGFTTAATLSLVSLACSVVALWGQLAIVALALNPGADPRAATRTASRRLLAVIGVVLVLLLVLFALMIPLGVMLAASGMDMRRAMAGQPMEMTAIGPGVSLYVIGVSLLILWLVARLAVLTPVVVDEHRGLGAIPRAFALTRGLALRIVGVLILFGIVLTVSTLAVSTVFGSLLRLVSPNTGGLDIATVLTAIAVAAVSTAFTVLANVFIAKLYLACRDAGDVRDAPIEPV